MGFTPRVAAAWTIVFALGSACATHPPQTAWSYDEHVGVVAAAADSSCFTTKAPSLAAGSTLRVVDPASPRQWQAVILAPADSCLRASEREAGLRGYTIRFDGSLPQIPFLGFGLAGLSPDLRVVDGAMDVDADRHDEYFRSCTSAEGVHFTIWSDAPLTGRRRWHTYYPLGYDVSPTCTPAETAD
jgi:hypothetical protein